MSAPINNGGSAFPSPPSQHSNGFYSTGEGMTLRQYAAIKLRVPDSGTDWLDDMIVKSRNFDINDSTLAMFRSTDAMLKAREAK
jgi:hypothetical protein